MKKIISVILVLSVSLFAVNVDKNDRIDNFKERYMKKYQERISIMNTEKNCVSKIKSRSDFKVCKTNTRNSFKEIKEKRFSDRKNKKSYNNNKKISFLKVSENCIQGAKTHKEYKKCEENERTSRKSLK